MNRSIKIGAGQFFWLIFLSRGAITLTYAIGSGGHIITNADWMAALLLGGVLPLIALPAFWFLKVSGNRDICQYALTLNKGVGVILSAAYGLWFLYLASAPAARFSFFVVSTMQPEKGSWFFPILILLPVCFAATKGIQAIARTGSLLAVAGLLAVVVILVALFPRIDPYNLFTPLYDGWGEVGRSLMLMTSNSLEVSMLLMLAPFIRGNLKRSYGGYCLAIPVFLFLIQAAVVAVLGEYAHLQLFPFYSVAGVAKVGELANLSALEASVWIVGAFVKSSVYLFLSARCFGYFLPRRLHKPTLWLLGVIAIVMAGLSSHNVEKAKFNFSVEGILLFGGVFLIIIPLLLALAGTIKRRQKREKSHLSIA